MCTSVWNAKKCVCVCMCVCMCVFANMVYETNLQVYPPALQDQSVYGTNFDGLVNIKLYNVIIIE